MAYTIRPAGLADAEAIAQVHKLSWQTSYRGILPDSVLDTISLDQRTVMRRKILAVETGMNWVAVHDSSGEIAGFCDAGRSREPGALPEQGELYAIYVLEAHKRSGCGRRLVQTAMQALYRASYTSMSVHVLRDNVAARRFYEKTGGQLTGDAVCTIDGQSYAEVSYLYALAESA
jgi:ribosomal protein S18 acetylase RimI-like enzyme